jgi:hypothetical protein
VIVGADWYDNVQPDEGKAYVYHGSASGLAPAANWTAESDQPGAQFGNSVSTAGDVNGDGYSDVIVGAYLFDNGQPDEGRTFVYHGSASGLAATASWTAESDQQSAYFGYSVSAAGDVNGDGYSDVIVGANQFDNAETDEGRTYIYYGSSSGLPLIAIWTAESNQASALFGNSVSTAGDINGDGFSDVIVGSLGFDNGQVNEGRAFVYYGDGPPLISVNALNIALLIQGHYVFPSMSGNIAGDTVRVYLRNGSSPYAIVDSAKAYVNEDIFGLGQGDFIFSNAVNGTPYYIVLRHRNSIETWSKTPQQFTNSGLSYDFKTAKTQAYGDNLTEVDISIFGVYSGDVNQDATVDATDVSMIDNDAQNFVNGYVVTDLTGDNFVDGTDFAIADNNASNFVSVIRP